MSGIKEALYNKDLNTLMIFNNTIKCRFLDMTMPKITHMGGAVITISTCLLIIILGTGEIRKIGFRASLALAVSQLLVLLLKNCVCRLRPKDVLPDINTFDMYLDYYSFPSGHTTAAFAIAATLSINIPVMSLICLPIALIVGISRLYLGVHYPSDVLAGMAVALITSISLQMLISI